MVPVELVQATPEQRRSWVKAYLPHFVFVDVVLLYIISVGCWSDALSFMFGMV